MMRARKRMIGRMALAGLAVGAIFGFSGCYYYDDYYGYGYGSPVYSSYRGYYARGGYSYCPPVVHRRYGYTPSHLTPRHIYAERKVKRPTYAGHAGHAGRLGHGSRGDDHVRGPGRGHAQGRPSGQMRGLDRGHSEGRGSGRTDRLDAGRGGASPRVTGGGEGGRGGVRSQGRRVSGSSGRSSSSSSSTTTSAHGSRGAGGRGGAPAVVGRPPMSRNRGAGPEVSGERAGPPRRGR